MYTESIPSWVVIPVLLATGIYFLGRWEGWWENLAARMTKKNKEN